MKDLLPGLAAFLAGWRRDRRQYVTQRRLRAQFPQAEFHTGATADADCRLGTDVVVHDNTRLFHCTVGRNTYFAEDGGYHQCSIGAFCSFGPGVRAGLGQHPSRNFVSTHPSFYSGNDASRGQFAHRPEFAEFSPITIGNDVWVGAAAIILDDVTIGNGAIIAAGAVVTKDVLPYTIVGGVPAKEIRARFTPDQIQFLQQLSWWTKDDAWIRAHAGLFHDIEQLRASIAEESR